MASAELFWNIDEPKPGDALTPFVTIRGWLAVSPDSKVVGPHLNASPDLPLRRVARADVEEELPEHQVVGFCGLFSISDFPTGEPWSLRCLIDGEELVLPTEFQASPDVVSEYEYLRKRKSERILEILLCPLCSSGVVLLDDGRVQCLGSRHVFPTSRGMYDFLPSELRELGGIDETENVSAHRYDPVTLGIIEECRDGLVLDNGCGFRDSYYGNVVNFEIASYPSTDVLGIGESLPFKDASFDAVLSLAVLEHVRDPFRCAREIARVTKPGGRLYAAVPFLQHYHGYPHHYYNMTRSGLQNLFDEHFIIESSGTARSGLPIWTLSAFLNAYVAGLPEATAKEFLEMKVENLLRDPIEYLGQPFVEELNDESVEMLASTNFVLARKR